MRNGSSICAVVKNFGVGLERRTGWPLSSSSSSTKPEFSTDGNWRIRRVNEITITYICGFLPLPKQLPRTYVTSSPIQLPKRSPNSTHNIQNAESLSFGPCRRKIWLVRAVRSGARGFRAEGSFRLTNLLEAMRVVANGGAYLSPQSPTFCSPAPQRGISNPSRIRPSTACRPPNSRFWGSWQTVRTDQGDRHVAGI